jgi:hypothetical protein
MIKIEHNAETNEIVEIELPAKEVKEFEAIYTKTVALELKEKAEEQTKATARQAVLDRLGLTAEEAQLLLGGN